MANIEMNLKVKRFKEKTVKPTYERRQGYVYLPKDWIGKTVLIIEEEKGK